MLDARDNSNKGEGGRKETQGQEGKMRGGTEHEGRPDICHMICGRARKGTGVKNLPKNPSHNTPTGKPRRNRGTNRPKEHKRGEGGGSHAEFINFCCGVKPLSTKAKSKPSHQGLPKVIQTSTDQRHFKTT